MCVCVCVCVYIFNSNNKIHMILTKETLDLYMMIKMFNTYNDVPFPIKQGGDLV